MPDPIEPEKSDYRFSFLEPPCFYCKHLLQMGTQRTLEGWTCQAYPEGIPYGILMRYLDHTQPLVGDLEGFTFESKEYTFSDGVNIIDFAGYWRKKEGG